MSDDTIGEIADEAKVAAPGSITWNGWRLTYMGEVKIPDKYLTGSYTPWT